MKKLINLFLELEYRNPSVPYAFNINHDVDDEVLQIYEDCQQQAHKFCKNSSFRIARLINQFLEARLTQVFSNADLLNLNTYNKLTSSVKNWHPWQGRKQTLCLKGQQCILKLLPVIRQKLHLQKLCREYREHLQTEIETQVRENYPQGYTACNMRKTLIFAAPPKSDKEQINLIKDHRSIVDRLAANQTQFIVNPPKPLALALEKYNSITRLQESLNTPVKSAFIQVKDFREKFKVDREILEKNRDKPTTKFIKGVVTLFSLGLAYVLGIWKVEGRKTAANLQKGLKPIVPTLPNRKSLCPSSP